MLTSNKQNLPYSCQVVSGVGHEGQFIRLNSIRLRRDGPSVRGCAPASLARDYIAKARKQLESIKDKEDKKIYADQINETESLLQLK